MKGKKGICLILCLLLLTGLAPLRAAVSGEQADGVCSSIALTGGANKIIYSADGEIEQQILSPNEQTPEQFLLPEGVSYDAASNTLTLTNFNAPTARLVLTMMGGDFRLRLSGSSAFASICSESRGRGGSITLCGDGALTLSGEEHAILVHADGAPDFVRVEPQVRLSAGSAGSVIRVSGSSLADGVILCDTSDPQVSPYDGSRVIDAVTTTDGRTLEPYTRPGDAGLYGVADDILSDSEGDRIVYNVYALGEKTAEGLYPVLDEVEHNSADLSGYERLRSQHDWILVRVSDGAAATQVRFARFTISTQVLGEGGTLSASQTEVARGGSVELSAVPWEGYKLSALTINDVPVSAANGSYVIGGITADQRVTASFSATTPSKLTVTAPGNTAFEVPAADAPAFVSEPFAALVTDGAGDPVGAEVRWSIAPEVSGVSIGSDGRVTVTSAAAEAAEEGPRSFTVTVSASSEGLSFTNTDRSFTVSLSERRAAVIRVVRDGRILDGTDTLDIPAAGGTTRQQYAAIVCDQYGRVRAEEIVWSAGDWPLGVRRDGDTLTVSDSCREGSTLVVTAKCASDNAVAASVTVSFTAPNTAKAAPAEAPRREAPVVSWPTVTLAAEADRVYGITWTELVTLSGGSAAIGEQTLQASFTINRDGSARPNVSDSFKIVCSYTDPDSEELKTVVSDEQTVTLAKKSLAGVTFTLSPETMPYAFGAACCPGVTLRDGTRPLIAGTDYSVTAYAGNTAIGTGSVTVEGLGNYKDSATKSFTITPIPGSSVTSVVNSCKPEDPGWKPAIVLMYGERTLVEGTDYDLALQYDIPSKTGTATVAFKGVYSGTRVLSFDLPNYLITEGAGGSWTKGASSTLNFKANGAFGKFTELTVDGKTVPKSYYSAASGSTVILIKPEYLKTLTAGKHIVGIAYKDGKALAIFSILETERAGVPTGDSNHTTAWIIVLAASLIAFGTLAYAFVRSGRKKKKRKNR